MFFLFVDFTFTQQEKVYINKDTCTLHVVPLTFVYLLRQNQTNPIILVVFIGHVLWTRKVSFFCWSYIYKTFVVCHRLHHKFMQNSEDQSEFTQSVTKVEEDYILTRYLSLSTGVAMPVVDR